MTDIAQAEWLHWPETQALAAVFSEAGEELRFVGGCVRDALLGRPVREVDAATPALPERVIALLSVAGYRAIPTGIDHGTVTALVGDRAFEITTLRRDVACDGRHAEVEYTKDWAEDAGRRDFTINALYADAAGEVFDYIGGLAHLSPLTLRFIGDANLRIREDGLRMLRYFRFMAQLGVQEADPAALSACRTHAGMIEGLSGERIAQEMAKLLGAEQLSAQVLALMQESNLLPPLGLPAPPHLLRDLIALEQKAHAVPQWIRRLAAWDGDARGIVMRWKLSNADAAALRLLFTTDPLAPDTSLLEQKKTLRRLGVERFEDVVWLSYARFHGDAAAYRPMLELPQRWTPPAFPISGDDLLARGFMPGPALGAALKILEAAWETSDFQVTRQELLAHLDNSP